MKSAHLLSALILSVAASATELNAAYRSREAIDRVLSREHVPGISVAVVQNGRVLWTQGRGWASLQPARKATPSTVYEIGSLGKQFTAVMFESLARDDNLDLDAPISRYLDGIPQSWSDITPRRLLAHQGGVAQIAPPDNALIDLTREYSPEEYTALATSVPLDFAPGTANRYSDTGYVLLGFALDRIVGEFYGNWMRTHLFVPLQMHDTRIIDVDDPPAFLAEGYESDSDGKLHRQRMVSRSLNRTADGSLWSTVEDLARWEIALESDAVLPSSTLVLMSRPAPLADGKNGFYHYGEGWEENRLRDQRVIEYDGSWQGFHGAMAQYPKLHLSVIVLGNRDDWRAQRLAHVIAGNFDARATPYRAKARTGPCAGRLRRWISLESKAMTPMGVELRTIGPILDIRYAEADSTSPDFSVYRIRATKMVDWMSVRCTKSVPEILAVQREY